MWFLWRCVWSPSSETGQLNSFLWFTYRLLPRLSPKVSTSSFAVVLLFLRQRTNEGTTV